MATTKASFGYPEPSATESPAGPIRLVMRAHISGTRNGADWPGVGGEITMPADEAAQLIRTGDAYPAPEPEEAAVTEEPAEAAVVPTEPEQATIPRPPERAVVSRARSARPARRSQQKGT